MPTAINPADGLDGHIHTYSNRRRPAFDIDNEAWSSFRAKRRLSVIIVGAGMGGLSAAIGLKLAGHNVTVLEAVPEIKEVGAGIQVAPNAARILTRFGMLEDLNRDGIALHRNSIRRWKDDYEIGTVPLTGVEKKYKAPIMVIHRADLQRMLLKQADAVGVQIRTSCTVIRTDPNFEARVQLQSGEWVEGDVVIAADGIKSLVRTEISKRNLHTDTSISTGDAAFRVTIPEEVIKGDGKAMKMLSENVGVRWMGPGCHIMAYPVKANKVYNMVLIHPERPTQENSESWTNRGTKTEMLAQYAGWNPTVRHLLSFVPEGEIMEWTLNSHRPLPSWVENKFALIGDSCHPMLPYVAQGAANAMEDAAVLTVALSLITSPSDISAALNIYQTIRKTRGEAIQASAATTQKALHLPDGPEQEERDKKIRMSSLNPSSQRNPDLWVDEQWQDFMWGVDVMKETLVRFDELMGKESGVDVKAVTASML